MRRMMEMWYVPCDRSTRLPASTEEPWSDVRIFDRHLISAPLMVADLGVDWPVGVVQAILRP